jgi:hypothetical protein
MTSDQPTRDQLLSAISSAVLAPSVHNTQPWLFRLTEGGVEVFADWRRQLAIIDPTRRAARMSCGAAVYNLRVALANMGFESWAEVGSHRQGPVATVLVRGRRPPTPADVAQYEAIGRRTATVSRSSTRASKPPNVPRWSGPPRTRAPGSARSSVRSRSIWWRR